MTNRFLKDRGGRYALLTVLVFLLLPVLPAGADIGRKPSMAFRFEYMIPKVEIIQGSLIQCEDAECTKGAPLEELGPQRFWCNPDTCTAIAYGFKKYQKLVIEFSDRTRESGVFPFDKRAGSFVVTVTNDRLLVEETESEGSLCQIGGIITILVELIIASLYVSAFGLPRLVLGWVPIASLITLPFVWSVFPVLIVPGLILTAVSEVFAVGVETYFLHRVTGKKLRLRQAFWLSLVMNAASFAVGLAALS